MNRERRCLLSLFCLVLVVVGCISISAGRIYISEIGTCQKIDVEGRPIGVTSTFPAGTRIVYLYFRLEGPVAVPLEFRWFHEGTLIGAVSQRLEAGLHYTWLSAGESQSLPGGNYRVEVIAGGRTKLGEARFVIRQEELVVWWPRNVLSRWLVNISRMSDYFPHLPCSASHRHPAIGGGLSAERRW